MKNFKKLFTGRLRRLPYFFGVLIISGVAIVAFLLFPDEPLLAPILSVLVPVLTLSLDVRRLHDIDLPGYLVPLGWLNFLGTIGIIISLIFNLFLLLKKGTEGANTFGKSPEADKKFTDTILNRGGSESTETAKK